MGYGELLAIFRNVWRSRPCRRQRRTAWGWHEQLVRRRRREGAQHAGRSGAAALLDPKRLFGQEANRASSAAARAERLVGGRTIASGSGEPDPRVRRVRPCSGRRHPRTAFPIHPDRLTQDLAPRFSGPPRAQDSPARYCPSGSPEAFGVDHQEHAAMRPGRDWRIGGGRC